MSFEGYSYIDRSTNNFNDQQPMVRELVYLRVKFLICKKCSIEYAWLRYRIELPNAILAAEVRRHVVSDTDSEEFLFYTHCL